MSEPRKCALRVVLCLMVEANYLVALASAGPPEWEAIRPVLEASAGALSPVTVEWERQSESPLSASKWGADVKSWRPQWDVLAPEKVTLSFQGNKFYFLRHFHQARLEDNPNQMIFTANKQLNDRTEENAFDGEYVYTGSGPKTKFQTSRLHIDKPTEMKKRHPDFPYMRTAYFAYAGFKLPDLGAEVGDAPKSLLAYLLDHGGTLVGVTSEQFDNAECAKLTIDHEKRRYEFYLDPAKHYAVLGRVETDQGGRRLRTVTSSEFRQLRPGVWLPARVDVAFQCGIEYGKPEQTFDQPIYSSNYLVSDLSGSPVPDERFSLNYTAPGTFIADGRLAGAYDGGHEGIQYVIPADEGMLDEAIANAESGSSFVPAKRTIWYAIITATVAIVAAICARKMISRRRTAP